MKEENINKLWKEYHLNKDPQVKEKLIIYYVQLVKLVAGRLNMKLGKYVEFDDLVSYGIFGLIDAIDKFSFEKGVKFETYASLRIRGSIIDNIRKLDWVPRIIRQQNKDFEKMYKEVEYKLGHEPSEDELSMHLKISLSEVRSLINDSYVSSLISYENFTETNGASLKDKTSMGELPETDIMKQETKNILISALDGLTDKEKIVVNMYYFDELTLKEISKVLSVSESRISQIHSKAIFKLGTKLGKQKEILLSL